MIAGVETGGTKVLVGVADEDSPHELRDVIEIPTSTPEEVARSLQAFLGQWGGTDRMRVGVASFGPLDLDTASPTYATITSTPKPGWGGVSIRSLIGDERDFVVVSDVTGAAIAESRLASGREERNLVYITVGTGVGVGAILDGAPVSSTGHPELGHMSLRRHPDDTFAGVCPFHGDCAEGLISGPAMASRWNRSTRDLGAVRDAAVMLEGYYLGQLLATVSYAYVPRRIVLGGGVMKVPGVLEASRRALRRELNGALGSAHPSLSGEDYVVLPAWGDHAGIHGALELALSIPLSIPR